MQKIFHSMNRYYFILTVLLINLSHVVAQHSLHGKVLGIDDITLSGATITLINSADTFKRQAVATDMDGNFTFKNLAQQAYQLKVSYVNYTPLDTTIVLPPEKTTEIILHLKASDTFLPEITVTALKKALAITAGKTTLHVEQSPLAQSQSAYDLLKSLPNVSVNKDGDIKVKGRSGVIVLLDGEPVEMGSTQLKNLLQSTPGATLKSVEVMSRPPANIDASGNAGVINFVFNKKVKRGTNGVLTSNIGKGKYVSTDHSLSLAHGTEKWDFSMLYAYNYAHTWQRDSLHRASLPGSQNFQMYQTRVNPNKNKSHLIKLGIDHVINEKNTIGMNVSFNGISTPANGVTRTFMDGASQHTAQLWQENILTSKSNNWDASLRFQHKFAEDQNWKFLFQHSSIASKGAEEYNVKTIVPIDVPDHRYKNLYPLHINKNVFKSDYTQLLSENTKLEAGIKSTYAHIRSSQTAYTYKNSDWKEDLNQGHSFSYTEAIQAAYASIAVQTGPWAAKAGLRGEHTYISGDSTAGNNMVKQRYLSLFPSAEVAYKAGDQYHITLGYNRRIDRPDYDQLNPVVRYLDKYTVEKGNPYLKPQFSDNIELTQQFFKFIDLTVGYSAIKNPIFYSMTTGDDLQSYFTTINAGKQHQWSASLSFPIPIASWWENYQSIYAYTSSFDAQLGEHNVREKGKSFGLYSYNAFKLPWKTSMEVTGWYQNGGLDGNFRYKPLAEVSLGVNKKLCNDKLTFGLSISDLFYTGIFKAEILGDPHQRSTMNFRTDSRVYKFSLSWKFGKSNDNKPQPANNDADPMPLHNKSKFNIKPGG